MDNRPFTTILIMTKMILGGDFTQYQVMSSTMVRRFPELQEEIDKPLDMWERIDLRTYVLNELVPEMQKESNYENCAKWIRAMRTRIVGDL